MAGINKAILIGNLGRDPETRFAQDGTKIVTFSLATSEAWKDKSSGERRERTEWHRVVIFNGRLADIAEAYLRKGMRVFIEGQICTRKWAGNDGIDRYTTEIVLKQFRGEIQILTPRGDGPPAAASAEDYGRATAKTADPATTNSPGGASTPAPSNSQDAPPPPDLDDEIPF